VRPSARPSHLAPEDAKHRDRFLQRERESVLLTCYTCRSTFAPRKHTKRGATHNFCSQACRLDWTKRQFSNLYRKT